MKRYLIACAIIALPAVAEAFTPKTCFYRAPNKDKTFVVAVPQQFANTDAAACISAHIARHRGAEPVMKEMPSDGSALAAIENLEANLAILGAAEGSDATTALGMFASKATGTAKSAATDTAPADPDAARGVVRMMGSAIWPKNHFANADKTLGASDDWNALAHVTFDSARADYMGSPEFKVYLKDRNPAALIAQGSGAKVEQHFMVYDVMCE